MAISVVAELVFLLLVSIMHTGSTTHVTQSRKHKTENKNEIGKVMSLWYLKMYRYTTVDGSSYMTGWIRHSFSALTLLVGSFHP